MLEPPQSGREAVGREGKAGVGQPHRSMRAPSKVQALQHTTRAGVGEQEMNLCNVFAGSKQGLETNLCNGFATEAKCGAM